MTSQPEDGSALAHLAVQVAAHRGQITGLGERLTEVEQALADMPGGKGLPAIKWAALSPEDAAAVRADLSAWVDGVLLVFYPSARDSLRDCWAAHADAITEVSLIWLEYKRVFDPSRPPLADALVYHDRWLPGALRRVAKITERCGQLEGCRLAPRR